MRRLAPQLSGELDSIRDISGAKMVAISFCARWYQYTDRSREVWREERLEGEDGCKVFLRLTIPVYWKAKRRIA
jgi:hypothetical protein